MPVLLPVRRVGWSRAVTLGGARLAWASDVRLALTAKPNAEAMADEPVWGHFHRFARVSGFRSIQSLEAAFPAWNYSGIGRYTRLRSAIVEYLAGGTQKRRLYNYFQAHSPHPQVLLPCNWLYGWRYMLNRWAFHNADFYRAPLTVRSCPACAREDLVGAGFAWFRRMHQLPGVDWCLKHSHPLHVEPAPMNFLDFAKWKIVQVPLRTERSGRAPPFIHRYIYAITWLAESSGCPDRAYQLTRELNKIEFGEYDPRYGALRLMSAPTSIAPMDWYRSHFQDPTPPPPWAFDITNEFTIPSIALRAAALTQSLDDMESLTTQAESGSKRSKIYSIDDLQQVLDLDDHFPDVEGEKLDRIRWPHCRTPRSARVGLGVS